MRRLAAIALTTLALLSTGTTRAQAPQIMFEGKPRTPAWSMKFMGRFQQTNQWGRLDELSRSALEVGESLKHPGLKRMGQWYQTLVAAQNNESAAEVIDKLRKAIEFGYRNVNDIGSADQLAVLRADPVVAPQFEELLAQLIEDNASLFQQSFVKQATRQVSHLAATPADALPVANYATLDGKSLLSGKPFTLMIVSRTYHEGLTKQWPIAKSARDASNGRLGLAIAFYENDAKSELVQGEAKRFIAVCGAADERCAVIDRPQYVALRNAMRAIHDASQEKDKEPDVFNPYFPSSVVVDADGRPRYVHSGVLEAREIAWLVEQLTSETPAKEEAKPKEEPEPAEEKTEEPAPEPQSEGEARAESPKSEGEKAEAAPPAGNDEAPKDGDSDKDGTTKEASVETDAKSDDKPAKEEPKPTDDGKEF